MPLFARIVPNTIKAAVIFTAVAFVVVVLPGGTANDIIARLIAELPPLVTLSAAVALAVNLMAATGGAIIGGSALAAALVAGVIGWAAVRAGAFDASELGQFGFACPTLVGALAIPWLFGSSRTAL